MWNHKAVIASHWFQGHIYIIYIYDQSNKQSSTGNISLRQERYPWLKLEETQVMDPIGKLSALSALGNLSWMGRLRSMRMWLQLTMTTTVCREDNNKLTCNKQIIGKKEKQLTKLTRTIMHVPCNRMCHGLNTNTPGFLGPSSMRMSNNQWDLPAIRLSDQFKEQNMHKTHISWSMAHIYSHASSKSWLECSPTEAIL